jgi:hypothetical protein
MAEAQGQRLAGRKTQKKCRRAQRQRQKQRRASTSTCGWLRRRHGRCFQRTRGVSILSGGAVAVGVTKAAEDLDGAFITFCCKKDHLPDDVPTLPDRHRSPRELLKVKNQTQLEPLYSMVSEEILKRFPDVANVKCCYPQFCACLPSAKRTSWGHGMEHRDTVATANGYLTVIVFYDNLTSSQATISCPIGQKI